jgi:hypothetical protein
MTPRVRAISWLRPAIQADAVSLYSTRCCQRINPSMLLLFSTCKRSGWKTWG